MLPPESVSVVPPPVVPPSDVPLSAVPLPPSGRHWRLLSTITDLDPAWLRYLDDGAA